MKIEATTTFLDGTDRFEAGDVRTVDDERGARLVANGWAQEVGADAVPVAPTSEVTLDIHNGVIGLGDSNG